MEKLANFINGVLAKPIDGQYINNISPADGRIYSLTPNSNKKDVASAFRAAKKAFVLWGGSTKQHRYDWSSICFHATDLYCATPRPRPYRKC